MRRSATAWRAGVAIVLGVLFSCAEQPAKPELLTTWTIAAEPAVRVDGNRLPGGHELAGVVSARRLADRRLVVGNSGGYELAMFDSAGVFLRAVGRKGSGPADFLGTIHVFAGSADSLDVYDGGNQRWSILTPELMVGRSVLATDSHLPHPVWVRRGALVSQPDLQDPPGWVLRVLDTLRAADPTVSNLIEARLDDIGALWVRRPDRSNGWIVYLDDRGSASARVDLPTGFDVLQIGADFVMGRTIDSLGVESIALHRLRRSDPGLGRAAAATPASFSVRDPGLQAELSQVLQAQEIFYSQTGRYTSAPDRLQVAFKSPLSAVSFCPTMI